MDSCSKGKCIFFLSEQVIAGTLSTSPAATAHFQPDSPCSPSTVKSFVLGEPGSEGMMHSLLIYAFITTR